MRNPICTHTSLMLLSSGCAVTNCTCEGTAAGKGGTLMSLISVAGTSGITTNNLYTCTYHQLVGKCKNRINYIINYTLIFSLFLSFSSVLMYNDSLRHYFPYNEKMKLQGSMSPIYSSLDQPITCLDLCHPHVSNSVQYTSMPKALCED